MVQPQRRLPCSRVWLPTLRWKRKADRSETPARQIRLVSFRQRRIGCRARWHRLDNVRERVWKRARMLTCECVCCWAPGTWRWWLLNLQTYQSGARSQWLLDQRYSNAQSRRRRCSQTRVDRYSPGPWARRARDYRTVWSSWVGFRNLAGCRQWWGWEFLYRGSCARMVDRVRVWLWDPALRMANPASACS